MMMTTMKRDATPRLHKTLTQAAPTVVTITTKVAYGARTVRESSQQRELPKRKKKQSSSDSSGPNMETTLASSGAPTIKTKALKLKPRKPARWLSNTAGARDISFETGKTHS